MNSVETLGKKLPGLVIILKFYSTCLSRPHWRHQVEIRWPKFTRLETDDVSCRYKVRLLNFATSQNKLSIQGHREYWQVGAAGRAGG